MNDTVDRLKNLAEVFGGKCAEDCLEAADTIEKLRKERDECCRVKAAAYDEGWNACLKAVNAAYAKERKK